MWKTIAFFFYFFTICLCALLFVKLIYTELNKSNVCVHIVYRCTYHILLFKVLFRYNICKFLPICTLSFILFEYLIQQMTLILISSIKHYFIYYFIDHTFAIITKFPFIISL